DDGYAVAVETRRVGLVRDEHGRLRVAEPVRDALVPVEDRHREKQGAQFPGPEEDRRRLRRRRQHHGDAIAAFDPVRLEEVRGLAREILELAPRHLPLSTVVALVDHRELLAGVLVAAVRGDVVALRNTPGVRRTDLVVAADDRPESGPNRAPLQGCRQVPAGAEGLEPPTYGFGDR